MQFCTQRIRPKGINIISKLALCSMPLCLFARTPSHSHRKNQDSAAKYMPLNVWTFLIDSINDAIKIIHNNITPNKHKFSSLHRAREELASRLKLFPTGEIEKAPDTSPVITFSSAAGIIFGR